MSDHREVNAPAFLSGFLKRMQLPAFPPMGDARKRYGVELTEPEVNAIYAAVAFIEGACKAPGFEPYWQHYGPALKGLSDRLAALDDGNAPYTGGAD